jgi:flagellar hook assembly protein FlgD
VSVQGNFDNVRLTTSESSDVDAVTLPYEFNVDVRPNPFTTVTHVHCSTSALSPVTVRVYDAAGRAVRTLLHEGAIDAGQREILWDGTDDSGVRVSSGVYLVRLSSRDGSRVARLLLVR